MIAAGHTIALIEHTECFIATYINGPAERSHYHFPVAFREIAVYIVCTWIAGIFHPVIIAILLIHFQEFPSGFQSCFPTAFLIVAIPCQMFGSCLSFIIRRNIIEQRTCHKHQQAEFQRFGNGSRHVSVLCVRSEPWQIPCGLIQQIHRSLHSFLQRQTGKLEKFIRSISMVNPRHAAIIADHVHIMITNHNFRFRLAHLLFVGGHIGNFVYILNIDIGLSDSIGRVSRHRLIGELVREVACSAGGSDSAMRPRQSCRIAQIRI